MTEFISRKYGNEGYEIIIKTDIEEHYKIAEDFARKLIDHAKPATDNNVGHKWIPVTERLPDEYVSVLVCIPTEHPLPTVKEAYLANGCWSTKMWIFDKREVTHWMPMPEPPNGGADA